MKILILSDIHANWYALEAILDNEFSINEMNFELFHWSDLGRRELCKCKSKSGDLYCNYYHDVIDEEQERKFILVGHSHKPFIKTINNTTILNPGSVGQPRDFNPRASYAVIDNGTAYIRRATYDIERTVKCLEKSALPKHLTSKLISMLIVGGIVN